MLEVFDKLEDNDKLNESKCLTSYKNFKLWACFDKNLSTITKTKWKEGDKDMIWYSTEKKFDIID